MIKEQTAILNERAKFKINFDNTPVEHEFWICKFRDVDMILGNDFFKNLKEMEEKQPTDKIPIKYHRKKRIETEDQTADNSSERDEGENTWDHYSKLHSSKSSMRKRTDIDITQLIQPAILEGLWTETETPSPGTESSSHRQTTKQAGNQLNTVKNTYPEGKERTDSALQNTERLGMNTPHHNQVLVPIKHNSDKCQKMRIQRQKRLSALAPYVKEIHFPADELEMNISTKYLLTKRMFHFQDNSDDPSLNQGATATMIIELLCWLYWLIILVIQVCIPSNMKATKYLQNDQANHPNIIQTRINSRNENHSWFRKKFSQWWMYTKENPGPRVF